MTASIIGCDAFSADRSLHVASQCSIHGRRETAARVAGFDVLERTPPDIGALDERLRRLDARMTTVGQLRGRARK
jgi:hypothetical protein